MNTGNPFPLHPDHPQTSPCVRHCAAGETIYHFGETGTGWRVTSGLVRLDRTPMPSEEGFVSLAVTGDVIGAETLLFGRYTFSATALSPCTLVSWPEGEPEPMTDALLQVMAANESRAADLLGLRCGQARERIRNLLCFLAREPRNGTDHSRRVALPALRDMAQITALTCETVSRTLSALRKMGILKTEGQARSQLASQVVSFVHE